MTTFPLGPAAPLLSFGVAEGGTLTITVEDGDAVEWASPSNGPFDDPDGQLAAGESRDFTLAVTVRTTGTSTVDASLPELPPPDDRPPGPPET